MHLGQFHQLQGSISTIDNSNCQISTVSFSMHVIMSIMVFFLLLNSIVAKATLHTCGKMWKMWSYTNLQWCKVTESDRKMQQGDQNPWKSNYITDGVSMHGKYHCNREKELMQKSQFFFNVLQSIVVYSCIHIEFIFLNLSKWSIVSVLCCVGKMYTIFSNTTNGGRGGNLNRWLNESFCMWVNELC